MRIKRINYFVVFAVCILLITQTVINAEGNEKSKGKLQKVATQLPVTFLDINNIFVPMRNNGISDIDINQQNSGLVFPKGSGKTAAFTSGLLWGATIPGDPQVRIGGVAYASGLQPGVILPDGTADDPTLDKYRIYRVRPDIYPGGPTVSLSNEATLEASTESSIRSQYEADWIEWPADLGAPYFDGNDNGQYDSDPTSGDIPGVPGADQTIWFVTNDLNATNTADLYGASPMGIEAQITYWAYNQSGALGNMYFRKYRLINKGAQQNMLEDMYVSMWSDVDLGASGDDFVGVDTVLSLQFCYNAGATDAVYSPLPPPAVGFDFFQGPLVTGVAGEDINKNGVDDAVDYGIFNGQVVGPGKINLPMTAAYYFANGDPNIGDPPQGDLDGSTQFYNFFQGKYGLSGATFTDFATGQPTTYALNGDPVNRTGWLDGDQLPPGDRRQGSASGPFTLAPGDTQEVVVAEICAGAIPGVDRLSAISLLKFYDQIAQVAYDNFFDLPTAPPPPEVNVVELDKEIVLDWGESQSKIRATETFDSKGYKFQGYNVYQLPSASSGIDEGTLVATFDIVDGIGKIFDNVFDPNTGSVVNLPVQFGNDTGIKRSLNITLDQVKGGVPLVNGIRYYFAVTAYDYNTDPNAVPNNLENPLRILTVEPRTKNPGEMFGAEYSDTIEVSKQRYDSEIPFSDGMVYPVVVDPRQLTGMTYTVTFENIGDSLKVWNADRSDGVRVLENQTNQLADFESPIADGIQFRVIGAPQDFKGFDITANGNGVVEGGDYANSYEITPLGLDGIGVSADWYRDVALSVNGGALGINSPMQAGGGYFFCVAGGSTITDHEAALGRWTRDGANWSLIIPNNYEIRWTTDGGSAGKGLWPTEFHDNVPGGTYDVPFQLWFLGPNLDDPSDDIRMIPVILDNADTAGTPVPPTFGFVLDHEASGGNNDPYSDWIYFYMPADQSPGDAGYQAFVAASPTTRDDTWDEHIARFVLMNWNQNQGDGSVDAWPDQGTVFRIRSNIPNSTNDFYTFTAPSPSESNTLAKNQVNQINVFPNPYYGVNSEELNKYNRFVTFSHLPKKATIRIFNLAGVLVKTIEKNNQDQFQRWDLANENGLPVASGLYIAYIDMPDVGTTKILKVAIVQEEQILDRF